MKVEYVARHYELNDQVREFTENKLRKLDKFLQEPVDARVTLEVDKHRKRADLHLAHRFGVIQATEVTADMYDAINLAVDKAEKQARRSNKKFQTKRRRGERGSLPSWPVSVIDRESVASGKARVIKSSHLPIEYMSLEEAAEHLGESKNEFFVFRNLDTDQVNVLYRRRDDNYGLISPEL